MNKQKRVKGSLKLDENFTLVLKRSGVTLQERTISKKKDSDEPKDNIKEYYYGIPINQALKGFLDHYIVRALEDNEVQTVDNLIEKTLEAYSLIEEKKKEIDKIFSTKVYSFSGR